MKILVLGLPRTGTQSLADALVQLGISPTYHMREVAKNKHQGLWIEALEAKFEGKGTAWQREDFERIFAGFEGAADFPASIFPQELVKAYPEAAIILSIRPEDAWVNSMMSTLWHAYSRMPPNSGSSMSSLSTKYHSVCWDNDFPANGREHFRKHNEVVRNLGKDKKFLEWDVKDGWGPLCAFLDVPAPDAPFPRHDDWVSYEKEMKEQTGCQPT